MGRRLIECEGALHLLRASCNTADELGTQRLGSDVYLDDQTISVFFVIFNIHVLPSFTRCVEGRVRKRSCAIDPGELIRLGRSALRVKYIPVAGALDRPEARAT